MYIGFGLFSMTILQTRCPLAVLPIRDAENMGSLPNIVQEIVYGIERNIAKILKSPERGGQVYP